MSTPRLLEMLAGLKEYNHSETGATESDIVHIENSLNVKLSNDYREFIKKYGYAVWFGGSIYGTPTNSRELLSAGFDLDTISNTIRFRKLISISNKSTFPTDGIVVGKDDEGGAFYLYSMSSSCPGKVVWLSRDEDWNEVCSWEDFGSYIRHIVSSEKVTGD